MPKSKNHNPNLTPTPTPIPNSKDEKHDESNPTVMRNFKDVFTGTIGPDYEDRRKYNVKETLRKDEDEMNRILQSDSETDEELRYKKRTRMKQIIKKQK